MYTVGKIDVEKYRVVSPDIRTDEVIITEERIRQYLDLGVGRCILGTVAVKDFDFTARMAQKYGGQIAVGVDARDGYVAVNGWKELSRERGMDICRRLRDAGVRTVIYTDISRDGAGRGTNLELYEELVNYYRTTNQFTDLDAPEELTPWQSSDGVACQVAHLTGYKDTLIYCTKLVIAPQKNLVLTFCGQAYKDQAGNPSRVWYPLNLLCESLTFEVGTRDEISGNTFLCGDGSQLCLQDGGDFRWYSSAEDHEKPYYEGIYEVYYGQAAMDKVASMTEYGLTMEELEQVLAASMNGYIPGGSRPSDYFYATGELEDNRERYQVCLDTFYAVTLHNQRLVSSPEDVQEGGNSVLYIGFYLPELEMADLTNCNAMSNTQWTFQEKTV